MSHSAPLEVRIQTQMMFHDCLFMQQCHVLTKDWARHFAVRLVVVLPYVKTKFTGLLILKRPTELKHDKNMLNQYKSIYATWYHAK